MESTGENAGKVTEMTTKGLEYDINLVDKVAAGFKRTPILKEVLLWVKCSQTALWATEKLFMKWRLHWCSKLHCCLKKFPQLLQNVAIILISQQPYNWSVTALRCCVTFAWISYAAAAAAKSLQSCPTLCNPIDSSPLGSPVPEILQARILEWVAISFSNAWKWKVKGKSLSRVRLFETPWTAAYQAPPSMGVSGQEYWSGVPLPSPWISYMYTHIPSLLSIPATSPPPSSLGHYRALSQASCAIQHLPTSYVFHTW